MGVFGILSAVDKFPLLNKVDDNLQMAPVSSTTAGSSNQPNKDDSGLVRQLRDRMSAMEKDLTTLHAGVAIVKKKGELATAMEACAWDELERATRSLQCK